MYLHIPDVVPLSVNPHFSFLAFVNRNVAMHQYLKEIRIIVYIFHFHIYMFRLRIRLKGLDS